MLSRVLDALMWVVLVFAVTTLAFGLYAELTLVCTEWRWVCR